MTKVEKAAQDAAILAQFEESIKDLPETEKTLMRTVKSQIDSALAKQTSENEEATAKALEDALAQLKEQETIKAMAKTLQAQGLAISRIEASKLVPNAEPATFGESLKQALEAQASTLEEVRSQGGLRKGQDLEFEVKGAVSTTNITEATTILSTGTYGSLMQNTGIVSPIRRRPEQYLQSVTTGTINTRYAMWIEETTEDGVPVMIAEATTKTMISVLYLEKTQKVEKIAVYSKVSTEMLADLPQLTSFIQNSMLKRVSVVIENQLFSGSGSTPQIKGATQWASSFAAGGLANSIPYANEIDVINAVANQTGLAFGTPNAIFVHPDTLNKIFGLKSTTGEPLYKDYMDWSIGGMNRTLNIAGMNVYATPAITTGYYLGGDMTSLNVLFRENLNIRLTPSGDDPISNLMTLIVEARLVQFASANDTGTIVYGDFATAIAALTSIALA
jgi:hypothetical protein